MQGLHGLLNGDGLVKAMNLQEIDVRGTQPLQTPVDRADNCRSTQATLVNVVLGFVHRLAILHVNNVGFLADGSIAFGHDDKLAAWNVMFLDCLADELFGDTIGVDIGGIPSVKPAVVGALEQFVHFFFIVDYPGCPAFVACMVQVARSAFE